MISSNRGKREEGRGKRGFTLIELLVVVAMIAVIMGAMTTSVASARERARIQKATSDVKVIAQAILAYENFAKGTKLEDSGGWQVANKTKLGVLLGKEGSGLDSGGNVPTLISTALSGKGEILDPWGHPYQFKITAGTVNFNPQVLKSNIMTGISLPNFYRISETER